MGVLSPTGRLREVTVDRQPLAVREWGEPDGTPLLFWHPLGTVASGAWLTELAPTLTRTYGLRLVAPDAPGFGRSPAMAAEDMSVPRLAALAWGLADELGLELPVLMGHSWGGVVMTCAAATRPADVAALVLLDSGHVDYGDHPQSNAGQSLDDRAAEVETQLEVWADRAALHAEVAADVRRPVTDLLLAAVEPAVRARPDGALVPVVAARSLAGARHAMVRERSSTRWASLPTPASRSCCCSPTSPPRCASKTGRRPRGWPRSSQLDARVMTGWGHDLIGDGGPDLAAEVGRWLAVSSRRR